MRRASAAAYAGSHSRSALSGCATESRITSGSNEYKSIDCPSGNTLVAAMQIAVHPSQEAKLSWLHQVLRKERKKNQMARCVVFVRSDEDALQLHAHLRKKFQCAVHAGEHAREGLSRFRENDRLVLVVPDSRLPSASLLAPAIAVSYDPPSGIAAARSRQTAVEGAPGMVMHQPLVIRDRCIRPPLDAEYALMLRLLEKLAGRAVPAALREAATSTCNRKRQREDANELVFFHGTSTDKARNILLHGFRSSPSGCLGPGVYVARDDKACRFAGNCKRHGGAAGARLKVRVNFYHPKYVPYDDQGWQAQGYDACRAVRTSWSDKMEWCLKRADQVEVVDVELVQCGAETCTACEP